jgi:undecaprenyl-diphosphatase
MLDQLLQLDRSLFHLINSTWSSGLMDAWTILVREKLFWAPLYLFLLVFAFVNLNRKSALWFMGGFLLTTLLCDVISSRVVKPVIARSRPCRDAVVLEEQPTIRVGCGPGYSFPSSHATNHFGVAMYLSGLLGFAGRWIKPVLLVWASVVAYAQVYVGVHFPLDVLAGAGMGVAIGSVVSWLFEPIGQSFKYAAGASTAE